MLILNALLCLFIFLDGRCHSAKILGIYSHPGKSHHILGEIILTNLAKRGHDVTMVSAFPLKQKIENYTDIYLSGFTEELRGHDEVFLEMEKSNFLSLINTYNLIQHFADKALGSPEIQALIHSNQTFDLIIMDWFSKDAELIYGNIFKAPIIVTSSFGTQFLVNYLVNNPAPYSYVPGNGIDCIDEMNFWNRIYNTVSLLAAESVLYYNRIRQQRILDKYFPNAPKIDDLKKNVALIFSNAHPTVESPRPYMPNIIPIGGIHIKETMPLPQDIAEFMKQSMNGVIYFSLGSHMKTVVLPHKTLQEMFNVFRKIPQKILLKWESDELPPGLPKNVLAKKWFPQNDVLADPNTKVFITHGGLQSKIEAVHHGVPMIGIPIFGDQKSNVPHSVSEEMAIQIRLSDLSEATLSFALNEIINNTRYKETMKQKSQLIKDQPLKPIDAAIYWTEFVLKYRGASHLQNKGMKLYWFQNLLLDIVLFFICIFLVAFHVFYKIILFGWKLLIKDKQTNKKKRN